MTFGSDLGDFPPGSRAVMITGALGFVGTTLSNRLLSSGYRVIGVDDRSSASPLAQALELRDGFSLLECDLALPASAEAVGDIAREQHVEVVFHLACPASPIDYLSRPIQTLEVSSIGTKTAATAALAADAVLVLASTSEVYGDPLESPQREEYWGNVNPTGPRAVYDEGKRYAEALVSALGRAEGLDYRIARLFNSYGPGMRRSDGRLIPAIVDALIAGTPVPIHGDGSQTRSLCFIDDTVSGLIALAASTTPGPINIGRDEEHTVLEIAQAVATLMDATLRIESLPARTDDPMRRRPDTTLSQQALGWRAETPLVDGLAKTLAYFTGEAGRRPVSRA